MKRIVFVIIAILVFNIDGKAQTTDKKQAIKELFVVMHQDSLMNKTMREMFMSMSASYKSNGLQGTNANNQMEKQMSATTAMVKRLVNEDMVDIYDKHFSLQEIKEFTIFYKSKSGQKLLNKSPEIAKDLMMTMTSKYLPDIQKSMRETEKAN